MLVIKSLLSAINKLNKNIKVIIIFLIIVIITASHAFYQTWKTYTYLRNENLAAASESASQVIYLPQLLNRLTANKFSFIQVWQKSLESMVTINELTNFSSSYLIDSLSSNITDDDVSRMLKLLDQLDSNLNLISSVVTKSKLMTSAINPLQTKNLQTVALIIKVFNKEIRKNHTILVIFQNSEELRATGGFMGSYAKISFNNARLTDFQIQDIYVPDGQFKGFVEAPLGAKTYLSGGKGLRLPDSNWHPDFPKSAQQILNYFSFGNQRNIDSVIAINLTVINEILKITGPIYVPDYNATITANNFADIARTNRESFFPGSQQKKHFLNLFVNQLIFKFKFLDTSKQIQLAKTLINQADHKNILFFSTQTNLEKLFNELNISGHLSSLASNTLTLMSVESNVGINKANQQLSRAFNFDIDQNQYQFEILFTNNNPKSQLNNNQSNSLNYINYQRIILNPEAIIKKIFIDDILVQHFDENMIENTDGLQFKQIGFLVKIPEKTSQSVKIFFEVPTLSKLNNLLIIKQPGIESIPVSVIFNHQQQSLTLEKDTLVKLSK